MTPTTLQQLIDQAKREGKWLFQRYGNLWFSPAELEEENRNGRFRWGPDNWELRSPAEFIKDKEDAIKKAEKELEQVKDRVFKEKKQNE